MNKSRLVRQLVWFVIAAAFPLSYAAGAALNPQFYSLRIALGVWVLNIMLTIGWGGCKKIC